MNLPFLRTQSEPVPGYLLAFEKGSPQAAAPFARLLDATLTQGRLAPVTKIGMGIDVAKRLGNVYAERHLARRLRAYPASQRDERERLALEYAQRLTDDVQGIDADFFRKIDLVFNDSEIVELTQTVCTMNYFVRLCAALGLVPEPWLSSAPAPAPRSEPPSESTRITLSSDEEMTWAGELASPTGGDPWGLGVRVLNSQRAMLRSPEAGRAWMAYWQSVRKTESVPRATLLQVSFAVSKANGCRYCQVHQVVGLRRQKIEIGKLLSLEKSDEALAPEEKVAVSFARKLTKSPSLVDRSDREALAKAFPDGKDLEIVLQTCAFSYMNRFTDNLGLPSEEEAVKIYKEVFGALPKKGARK
ncbi:MAG: carboxymuconolactone decarboxylase family protein [Armatimonas sp.]